ncbi:hypothetical protein GCM10010435_72830 [Winogradskya consettensis]|uniref:Uncharacterized protein n=1 Tax=Winogradskya consettensis TaxID=113560 RepID=A0A919SPM7_9ACTN|nr:hypothetical protein [Actinoplanes consettensis]GIM75304.1 hypothetical protein Aco04nite_44750 [Actinoplanes consettensis]
MGDLEDLAEIGPARARLEERELELIERARQGGATWGQVAGALGLGSRQAAEQRRQRLVAAARGRRDDHDFRYAHSIVVLRAAVTELHRSIAADRRWGSRFTRAELVRVTVETALDAAPGGLFALAAQAVDDLRGVRVPGYVGIAVRKVRGALSTDG